MMNVMHCLDKGSDRTEHHIHHDCFVVMTSLVSGREDKTLWSPTMSSGP